MAAGARIIITGGGRGIGARVARELARGGAALALLARTRGEVEAVAGDLGLEHGVPAHAFACDVARTEEAAAAMAAAIAALGGVDVLVNNAAVAGPVGALEETDMAAWTETLAVNLLGMVHCCRAVLPAMKAEGRGRIINLAGAGVGRPAMSAFITAYTTSKVAVCGFTEALAAEVRPFGIQVNAVSPGSVETRLRAALLPVGRPAGSEGEPLDGSAAARLIAFLASPDAGTLSGKMFSARWEPPEAIVREMEALGDGCRNTLRKIDGRNYVSRRRRPLR